MFACRGLKPSVWRWCGGVRSSKLSTPSQHRVSKYESMVLQLTGMTKGPVTEVSLDVLEKATSRFRIGLMFSMMGLTVLGSIIAVVLGKKDRAAHINTLAHRNRERHAKVKDSDTPQQ